MGIFEKKLGREEVQRTWGSSGQEWGPVAVAKCPRSGGKSGTKGTLLLGHGQREKNPQRVHFVTQFLVLWIQPGSQTEPKFSPHSCLLFWGGTMAHPLLSLSFSLQYQVPGSPCPKWGERQG